MKNIFKYVLLIIFCLFLFVFLVLNNSNKVNLTKNNIELNNIDFVKIDDKEIKVEIVKTKEAQAIGLSGREELKKDEGMLFVFEQPAVYSFWMKGMKFSIDMIWLDQDKKIIYIQKNATPESYPESFGPKQNALYVLEVVSGFSEENNLKIGDILEFAI